MTVEPHEVDDLVSQLHLSIVERLTKASIAQLLEWRLESCNLDLRELAHAELHQRGAASTPYINE